MGNAEVLPCAQFRLCADAGFVTLETVGVAERIIPHDPRRAGVDTSVPCHILFSKQKLGIRAGSNTKGREILRHMISEISRLRLMFRDLSDQPDGEDDFNAPEGDLEESDLEEGDEDEDEADEGGEE